MDVITKPRERLTHNIVAGAEENPYERASFSPGHRLARLVWQCTYLLLLSNMSTPYMRALHARGLVGAREGRRPSCLPARWPHHRNLSLLQAALA